MAERAWLGLDRQEAAELLFESVELLTKDSVDKSGVVFWRHFLRDSTSSLGCDEAVVHLAQGHWQKAEACYGKRGYVFHQAMAMLDGEADDCTRSLGILEKLGASASVEKIRRLLKTRFGRNPRGPRPSTKQNYAGLTRREIEVLSMIEAGNSNIKIGLALFISPKTVDHHVSSIIGKLGVTSRGEAAALARKLDLCRDHHAAVIGNRDGK